MKQPHDDLRSDVRLLGHLLGEVLQEHEGKKLFQKVEQVRKLAKKGRSLARPNFTTLAGVLKKMSEAESVKVARAFAHFLQLANIAEEYHRTRRRREYQLQSKLSRQPYSYAESFLRFRKIGASTAQLQKKLENFRMNIVLTAHPTEALRRTLLQKHTVIAENLQQHDRADLTFLERESLQQNLKREIKSSWLTDEIRRRRMSPLDEVRGGLYMIEQVLWNAAPQYIRELQANFLQFSGKTLNTQKSPLSFSSWMGGDRDGNPNVTAAVTQETILLHLWMAAKLYWREVDQLRAELSMSSCDAKVRTLVGDSREPYRELLRPLRDQLAELIEVTEQTLLNKTWPVHLPLHNKATLRAPLQRCFDSLCATGAAEIAHGRLQDLLWRVDIFGLFLLRLDLRQEASKFTAAVGELLKKSGQKYLSWSEEEKMSFLREAICKDHMAEFSLSVLSLETQEVLNTFFVVKKIGPEAFGRVIISMASQASQVLEVVYLQKICGVRELLPVVPLLEKVDDLVGGAQIFASLFAEKWYLDLIQHRQELMLGYSDSARISGKLASVWQLYQTQEELVSLAKKFSVKLSFFHGRGGSIGRGGGPVVHGIRSQPAHTLDEGMSVTEQGEVIQLKYGLPQLALRTFELYTTSVIEAQLLPPSKIPQVWRTLMQEMADVSQNFYQEIFQREDFNQFFDRVTPQRDIARLNIGSRPAHRGGTQNLQSMRAIPWMFAWTQTRHLLPTWLGVGAALQEALREGKLKDLRKMYRDWPFFHATIDLIEMALAKAAPNISAYYEEKLLPKELLPLAQELRAEFQNCCAAILHITQHKVLLQHNQVLARSIEVRNPYVDPVNLLQVELLQRLRQGQSSEVLADALLITINGIAAGMRNTG